MLEEDDDIDSDASSSVKHFKSKAIKKVSGNNLGFSKSPKLMPSQAPINELPAYYMIGGANIGPHGKKAKHQATLVKMRKDSILSEKEKRREKLHSGNGCGGPLITQQQ
jgi:hypothetical protein